MGKGRVRKCKKKYRYGVNKKKLWKKSKRLPGIENRVIRENWIHQRSIGYNLEKMGLSGDPNASLRIPNTSEFIKANLPSDEEVEEDEEEIDDEESVPKTTVVEALEKDARRPRESGFHVSLEISMFVKYMSEKYGNNYKAMSRDPKNYYQLTPRQIRKRFAQTKRSQMVTATRLVKKMIRAESENEPVAVSSS